MGKKYNDSINSQYTDEFLNWQDTFYSSKKWKKVRDSVKNKYFGICQICKQPNKKVIVHHINPITPENCNNPEVLFNEDNLQCVCIDCHNDIHLKNEQQRLMSFDENGNLIYLSNEDKD